MTTAIPPPGEITSTHNQNFSSCSCCSCWPHVAPAHAVLVGHSLELSKLPFLPACCSCRYCWPRIVCPAKRTCSVFLLYRSWSRVAAAQDPISCYSLHVEGYEAVNLLVIYVLQLLKLLFHVVHVLQLLKVSSNSGYSCSWYSHAAVSCWLRVA